MNLDEKLERAFGKGAATRIGRCPTRCGLKDSRLVRLRRSRDPQDHLCLYNRDHKGECAFLPTCGRSNGR